MTALKGMRSETMKDTKDRSQGFTLIATLLMLLLMSGLAIGLLMMVNTEQKVGKGDLQNNVAYHNAEGGIEHMTSDLAAAFKSMQAPTPRVISAIGNNPPSIPGVTWKDYQITSVPCGAQCYGQIQSGPNQGLWAQIIPVNMLVTAAQAGGEEVSMTRTAQVALIPVFQFGVFSDSDLGFYSSPTLNFNGRVHTNGDLYLGVASAYKLTFHDKLTAYGNVVRAVLPNGLAASSYNDTGTVLIPIASQGCDGSQPACRAIGSTEGSVTGAGGNPPQSSQNTNWPKISLSTYNGFVIDGNYGKTGGTGATNLSLPFVNGTNFPYEIIRRAPAGEPPASALGGSRLYNIAQIRVLLSDDPSELPGGVGVRLYNGPTASYGVDYTNGVAASVPGTLPALGAGRWYSTYFAEASTAVKDTTGWVNCMASPGLGADWALPGAMNNPTLTPGPVPGPLGGSTYNLIDGYLQVQYKNVAGNWVDVTSEWLNLGFARGLTPPTAPGSNPVNPNAILLFQEPADRNGNGVLDAAQNSTGGCGAKLAVNRPAETPNDANTNQPYYGDGSKTGSVSRNNWYPLNFYDTREGNPRDTNTGVCTANGVMNAVEIDVGNLQRWLAGQTGTNGTNVDYLTQNGYVLYFSDRRGMLKNPNVNPAAKTGDSGLEDSINSSSAAGTPDNKLDPMPNGKTLSPEDVNENGVLDNFGEADLGDGFNAGNTANGAQYSTTVNCMSSFGTAKPNSTAARKAWVSGARHVLKLVDGGFGNLPVRPDSPTCTSGTRTWTCKGGFTVASENPVYIQGDYNTNSADTIWNATPVDKTGPPYFAAAGIVADAVTVLSNNWSDLASFAYPTAPATGRVAKTTYYRVAIAAGKNMNFPFPSWESSTNYGTGTDGGVHNFLRFLESWNGVQLNYYGSLVSLYYSTYNTGMFKCCTYSVYEPPSRNYIFDADFAIPQGLPPGTPMFRDVNNLSYRQIYTQRTY